MAPIDFELPTADGDALSFDAEWRARKNGLLFFYRGRW